MGIILGALGGMGQAGMQVGQMLMKAGLDEDLEKQRMAMAEQAQQNALRFQQQLRLEERNRVGGIIKGASQAGVERAMDDGPNTPDMLSSAGSKSAQQALIESGDIDSAKVLGDMSNKEGLLALKEQQMSHDAAYRDQLLQLRQQALENSSKLASDKLAMQQALYETRSQAMAAQSEYRDALKGLNDEKTRALRDKALDSFYGAEEDVLKKKAADPTLAAMPEKEMQIYSRLIEIRSMKTGTIQLMEDANLSPARAHQLVSGLENGTTTVLKDKKTGALFIDAGIGKPIPMPPGLNFLLSKPRPGVAAKPSTPAPVTQDRNPFTENGNTDPLGNQY